MIRSNIQPLREKKDTHKRSFEHELGHEDQVGGIDSTGLNGSALDLDHAVEAGDEDDGYGAGNSADDDGTLPSLDPIQSHDYELPERSFEEQGEDNTHLGQDHRIQ
ncbi:hypothetical protein SLA2020_520810 [Shorea laevis]